MTAHLRNIWAVVVKIPASLAPTLRRHLLVDYLEPRQRFELDGVLMHLPTLAQGSQTLPWGIGMIRAPWVWSTTTTGSGENGGVKVLVDCSHEFESARIRRLGSA